MSAALSHRGPDDAGTWSDPDSGVTFGHRRLSIIDVSSAGHQPMLSPDGRFAITYNGEIYNHQELRRELAACGRAPQWRGHSDTETLLAAVTAWGVRETLERLVGMFALAIWDRSTGSLHLARDRLGEKPLYYGWVGSSFLFASELKAFWAFPGFRKQVDTDALGLFMQFGNIPAPYSIFRGISKLPPASVLTLSSEGFRRQEATFSPYWNFTEVALRGLRNPVEDENEALAGLEKHLRQAVTAQSIADVPLGAFLSGGIDSSLIAALMQAEAPGTVKTFTVGFEEPAYDESGYAKAVAAHLGTEHHEMRLTADDARMVIPQIPFIYDEPFADSSQIATHLVCRSARTRVKVALSGDGGDELFGGYNRYHWSRRVLQFWDRVPHALRSTAVRTLGRMPPSAFDSVASAFGLHSRVSHVGLKAQKVLQRLSALESVNDLHRLLLTEWPANSGVVPGARDLPLLAPQASSGMADLEHAMMMYDTMTYLPDDVLTKVDRAAMSVSLETRVPYLDHRVLEYAWRLPLQMKIRNGTGKWALRQILYKYVPRHLLERPKAGFAIPLGEWLRGPLRDWVETHLSEGKLQSEGYLDGSQIQAIWREHLSGRKDWTQRLWYVLTFETWLERNS